jgi:hypothetical protein
MVSCQDERINHFMNLPPQLPSSEEPEQQPVLYSSEETPTPPSLSSDQLSEEPQQQPVNPASEEPPTSSPSELPTEEPEEPAASASELSTEESEQPPTLPSDSLAEEPATPSSELSVEPSEEPLATPSELPTEELEQPFVTSFEPDGAENSALDEDETFASEQSVSATPQSSRSGVFIHKGVLIAVVSAIVVVALLASLLVVVTRPKDPPTDWIASYTPPAGTSSTGKVVYYLHWTNQNGELTGQMQLAAFADGAPQALTVPATGLYNRDNHIIYVVVTINGQADTLMGKINDTNDTLSLNPAGVTTQPSQFVFHIGTADDFKQATKKLATVTVTK